MGHLSLNGEPDETLVPTSATTKEDKAAAIKSEGKIIIQEFVDFEFHKEKPKAMIAAGRKQPKKAVQKSNPIWTTFKSMTKNCSL